MRDMLFLSHANPEDNDFASWLALELAKHGYPVWCDLTKLLGGEDFWTDIEHAIRQRTAKFLYIVSRSSNVKPGALNELQVATNVHRDHPELRNFIVPLLIDDLPPREFNIRISSLNAVSFSPSWAKGLAQLLARLKEDGVVKKPGFTPSAVASWWREQFSSTQGVEHKPEELLSNQYPVLTAPTLHCHELNRSGIGEITLPQVLPYPGVQHNRYLVSLADASSFAGHLGPALFIRASRTSQEARILTGRQERDLLVRLLKESWLRMVKARGLPTYEFANQSTAFYFTDGFIEANRLAFSVAGVTGWRNVVGTKTMTSADGDARLRYWHFGLEARLSVAPVLSFTMKPHVVFSDDGKTVWDSKERLHRARRSQCRNWWNAEWRDRMLATMSWFAGAEGVISLEVGVNELLHISATPLTVTSPISFVGPSGSGDEGEDAESDECDDEALDEDDDGSPNADESD